MTRSQTPRCAPDTSSSARRGAPGSRRGLPGSVETRHMSFVDASGAQATDAAVLTRIVIPFGQLKREDNLGEIRGMTRESCAVPFPPGARVVQAEKTEGAWVVWYVERVEAI